MRPVAPIAFLLVLSAQVASQEFSAALPLGVPNPSAWERVAGAANIGQPVISLRYEMFVNPRFNARYEVIRYRILGWQDGPGSAPYRPTERLQWQVSEKDLRRFECESQPSGPCRWRELVKGSDEYRQEVPVILWVLGVHRRLLQERAGS